MLSPFSYHILAASGHELQFAANHLGHFHLVNRLLTAMIACSSGTPRVLYSASTRDAANAIFA
jgi:hypothetical protein